MAGRRFPDFQLYRAPGQFDLDLDGLTVFFTQGFDWQLAEAGGVVVRNLVAVFIDGLDKVALPVEHADSDKRYGQIAGRFTMIARQYAETTGVDGQAFVQSELGAEVGDQILPWIEVLINFLALLFIQVGVVRRQYPVVDFEVDPVLCGVIQALLGDAPQEYFWIMPAGFPQRGIQSKEQSTNRAVPGVEQIIGQLVESGQFFRYLRLYFEGKSRAGHNVSSS